jgi:hypothetical protein
MHKHIAQVAAIAKATLCQCITAFGANKSTRSVYSDGEQIVLRHESSEKEVFICVGPHEVDLLP